LTTVGARDHGRSDPGHQRPRAFIEDCRVFDLQVGDVQRFADVQLADIQRDFLGDMGRQTGDGDVALNMLDDAAEGFHAEREAHEIDRDSHRDRFIHGDTVEIDMNQVAGDRVLLQLADDDLARGAALTLDVEVDEGVQGRAVHEAVQRPKVDSDRNRLCFRAVDNRRDIAVLTQTAIGSLAGSFPLLHREIKLFHLSKPPVRMPLVAKQHRHGRVVFDSVDRLGENVGTA
jgi:hypothetical protein